MELAAQSLVPIGKAVHRDTLKFGSADAGEKRKEVSSVRSEWRGRGRGNEKEREPNKRKKQEKKQASKKKKREESSKKLCSSLPCSFPSFPKKKHSSFFC